MPKIHRHNFTSMLISLAHLSYSESIFWMVKMCNQNMKHYLTKIFVEKKNVKTNKCKRRQLLPYVFVFFVFCIKSESHLSPVIVLLPWFSTKLPDISAGHVATTGTAHSNSKAFTTNAKFQWLLLPNVRGLWQVGKENLFLETLTVEEDK